LRDQYAHVKPVEAVFGNGAEFVYDPDWDPAKMLEQKPDVVLCVNDYHYDVVRCLDAAKAAGVPSLVLQDGILEWRCQYENPLFGAGGGAPHHQPVMADKIACIGAQSAREIARWGNGAKVEVTGMPRLDHLLSTQPPAPAQPGKRVLVMTAKNPGFTPEQCAVTVRSLKDVKAFFDLCPGIEVIWRVSGKVVRELDVQNQFAHAASEELAAVVGRVDAVISTPSTAILEAMLLRRPVAALDYHNVPRFTHPGWAANRPSCPTRPNRNPNRRRQVESVSTSPRRFRKVERCRGRPQMDTDGHRSRGGQSRKQVRSEKACVTGGESPPSSAASRRSSERK
jgi:hypothetical protein